MAKLAQWPPLFISLVVGASLTACAGSPSAPAPPLSSGSVAEQISKPDAGPPACKGQSTTSEYAMSATVKFKSKAAALCIPAFNGFGGTIEYPPAKPSVSVQSISSTTDYNDSMMDLRQGKKARFYLQLATSGATTFGTKLSSGGGLTGKAIVSGKTYTVYSGALAGGVAHVFTPFKPCNAVATSGKYGGVIAGLGTPMSGQTLTGAETIIIEIYPGSHAKAKC